MKTFRWFSLAMIVVLALALGGTVLAQDTDDTTPAPTATPAQPGYGMRGGMHGGLRGSMQGWMQQGMWPGHNHVDSDGDGVCDNFVDEDGDGVCDNAGQCNPP